MEFLVVRSLAGRTWLEHEEGHTERDRPPICVRAGGRPVHESQVMPFLVGQPRKTKG